MTMTHLQASLSTYYHLTTVCKSHCQEVSSIGQPRQGERCGGEVQEGVGSAIVQRMEVFDHFRRVDVV